MKFTIEVDNRTVALEIEALQSRLLDARPVMGRIATALREILVRNILSGDVAPDTEETLEKKARDGAGAKPLVWTGRSAANIKSKSTKFSARAYRGEEWWMFLHDLGAGRQVERKWAFFSEQDTSNLTAMYEDFLFGGGAA